MHFIGIGGCGMSGLARMALARGAAVTGSDREPTAVTEGLARQGFAISFEQDDGQIPDGTALIVCSAAIKPDHPELIAAQERGLPVLTYAEALGKCMRHATGVAIAGTHGKSTISAMLGCTLIGAGIDPTVIVGATCAQLSTNTCDAHQNGSLAAVPTGFRMGSDKIPIGPYAHRPGVLVAEACEYNRSFHHLAPTLAAISSVEADHLDIYGSLDAVIEAFHEFASLLPSADENGYLLINHDGAHRREVTAGLGCAVETLGFDPAADWHVTYDSSARRVGLNRGPEHVANWIVQLPGAHMALDSAFAAVLALRLGADIQRVTRALEGFGGLDRRMQFLGRKHVEPSSATVDDVGGVRVYDDYGHHPTEIDATLRALREYEKPELHGGRLICVFQPHQHSRTRFFLEEFAQSFSHADIVIVPHIYFVRDSEKEKTQVAASDLVDRLRTRGVQAMHLYPFEAIVEQLNAICTDGDLLVVMGAGPVWKVAHGFLRSDRPACSAEAVSSVNAAATA